MCKADSLTSDNHETHSPAYMSFQQTIAKQLALENQDLQHVHLTSVEVKGGEEFTNSFFQKLLHPLLSQKDYTLSELVQRVDDSCTSLQDSDVFLSVAPSLCTEGDAGRDGVIPTKVKFDVSPLTLSMGNAALLYNSEDNLGVQLGYHNNNFNRNAENLLLDVLYLPYKPLEALELLLTLVTKLKNPSCKLLMLLWSGQKNRPSWKSVEKGTGGSLALAYTRNRFAFINSLNLSKRTLQGAAPEEMASMKLLLLTRLLYSSKKTNIMGFAHSGVDADLSAEAASVVAQSGHQAAFFKISASSNYYKTHDDITAHIFAAVGAIQASGVVHSLDRFYMGGYDSFRGFARGGVAENGGKSFFNVSATVYSPLPDFLHKTKSDALRLYATLAIGAMAPESPTGHVHNVGVGLRYFSPMVTMDMGYFVALRTHGRQGIRDGFQLQLSIGARHS